MTMSKRIALLVPTLDGGGAERLALDLSTEFARLGFDVDLVVASCRGALKNEVSSSVNLVDLGARRLIFSLFPLARYLRKNAPDVIISFMDLANIIAILAKKLAFSNTRVIATCHQTLATLHPAARRTVHRILPFLMRFFYPQAYRIVAVSHSVADQISELCGIPRSRISVIYNMVDIEKVLRLSNDPDPSLGIDISGRRLVLAVGRLVPQKNFDVLISAFELVRGKTDAQLVILGEGPLRQSLEAQINSIGLGDSVTLPGFVPNPYYFMAQASVFVSTSAGESFGLVIAEALLCGCSIVCTAAPGATAELLGHGKYGSLVEPGDIELLATAILDGMNASASTRMLVERGIEIADPAKCIEKYLEVMGIEAPSIR